MTNLHAASMARYLARISCLETEALQRAFVTMLWMKYPNFYVIILVTWSSRLGVLVLPPPTPSHQNLDRIDDMKHLPGAWIWKTFRYCIIHSEATWGLLLCPVTAAENVSPLACLPLARPFFHAPTTSKRLLRRLVMFLILHWQQATQSVWTWHDYPWKSCTAVIHDMITCDLECPWHEYCIFCS